MIEVSEDCIDRVSRLLAGIPKATETVFTNAINRGLITARATSTRQISKVYNITQKNMKSRGRISVDKASTTNLEGVLTFAGYMIPLIRFNVKPASPKRQIVSVSVLREAGASRLHSAYVANLGKYEVGVFERLTRKRESSQELFGPSAAHMAGNENVTEEAAVKAQETIDKRVTAEVSRILNGYH